MKPLISVIVPVYNAGSFLSLTLESLARQKDCDLEFVLVDDGSKDSSGAICDAYAAKDARFRVIHKENEGVSSARNAGLDEARGQWIGFVDSDDWIEPDMYAYLLELVQKNGCDVAQCAHFYEVNEQYQIHDACDALLTGGITAITDEQWTNVANSNWSKLFSREIIGDTRFSPELHIGEDLHFNLSIFRKNARIVLGKEPKYHYIIRRDSLCHRAPQKRDFANYKAWVALAEGFKNCPALAPKLKRDGLHMLLFMYARFVQGGGLDAEMEKTIREEAARRRAAMRGDHAYSRLDHIKVWLICKAPRLYRMILPIWKLNRKEG